MYDSASPFLLFSNHGRSGGSQTLRFTLVEFQSFSNHGRSGGSQTPTNQNQSIAVVQQPWQIGRFSNLWVWICRLIWAFLFQRTAKSARSSCFSDPPDHFFDQTLGSPQASIPALTAVWIHYSKFAFKYEFGALTSVLLSCSVGNEYQERC